MNAKMPELKRCFEAIGCSQVKTVLGSGNVVFDARTASAAALEREAEAAMAAQLGRSFYTIVRSASALAELLDSDPCADLGVPAGAKRVVTFLREPAAVEVSLPIEVDGACILAVHHREVFSAYLPSAKGPVFMALIEKTFGKNVTTRTWDTVRKCAAA